MVRNFNYQRGEGGKGVSIAHFVSEQVVPPIYTDELRRT